MARFHNGHPVFEGYPLDVDYLDWIDTEVEKGAPGGDFYDSLMCNSEWWLAAECNLTKIVKWHQEEADRLYQVAEDSGSDKARSKARWHREALTMYSRFGLDTQDEGVVS